MARRQWTQFEGSKNDVKRAGKTLRDPNATPAELEAAWLVAEQFRSAHAYPLNTWQMRLRRYARSIEGSFVAQRQKRMPSIEAKLKREEHTQLDGMQDLGGIRMVLPSMTELREIERRLLEDPRGHDLKRHDDYLADERKLKRDGYRSVHIVYAYGTREPTPWETYRIEIQLRTRPQHIWATGLETVNHFTPGNLKAGGGPPWWHEFFALMSAEIAAAEHLPLPPGVPTNTLERQVRLLALEDQHEITTRLRGFMAAAKENDAGAQDKFVILDLDLDTYELRTRSFRREADASAVYAELEAETRGNAHRDVVLVRAADTEQLRKAYPNYFVDISGFINMTELALAVRREGDAEDWLRPFLWESRRDAEGAAASDAATP